MPRERDPAFAAQAALIRSGTGLGLRPWAKRLGKGLKTVWRWENGENQPNDADLVLDKMRREAEAVQRERQAKPKRKRSKTP